MLKMQSPAVPALAGTSIVIALALLACVGPPLPRESCATDQPNATGINVAGTYRYAGDSIFLLRGTITFAQEGDLVRVTGTTYDNSGDRDLISQPTALQGNRLDAVLTPKNGDPDYRAEVRFLFGDGGDTFCVEFSDTNGDAGPMGTYRGVRVAQ